MGKWSGQLGSPLPIQMDSHPLSLCWSAPFGGLGCQIGLVFQTIHVGDGASVAFQLLDGEGGTWQKSKGKIVDNLAKIEFKIDSLPKGGLLVAVASIQDLGVELRSGALPIKQGVAFEDLKIKDKDGAELKEVVLGEEVTLEGKVRNAPSDAVIDVRASIRLEDDHEHEILRSRLEQDKASFKMKLLVDLPDGHEKHGQVMLDRYSQKYKDAVLRIRYGCLGFKVEMPSIAVRENSTIAFVGAKGTADFVLADGSKRSVQVPEDGVVVLEKVPLGDIVIEGVDADETVDDSSEAEP